MACEVDEHPGTASTDELAHGHRWGPRQNIFKRAMTVSEGLCVASDLNHDRMMEALLEIDFKVGDELFDPENFAEPPGRGFTLEEIVSLLCQEGYLASVDGSFQLTPKARRVIDSADVDELISHLPFECHDKQK
jgi:hypothetical protein